MARPDAPAARSGGRTADPGSDPGSGPRRGGSPTGADAGERLITVWCPDWPVVAARAEPDVPVAVLRAGRILARTPEAAADGVEIGMRRRAAQRRCPALVLLDDDPDRDAAAFEGVVRTIAASTPWVEAVEAGHACLPARGPSRLFGGEEAFVERLHREVTAAALEVGASARVRIGVADGRFASALAAQQAIDRPEIVAPGCTPAHLAPLPIAWLHRTGETDAELVDLFDRLGLVTLGALAALDAADVLGRFGLPGSHAHRLAAGLDERGAAGTAPPEPIVAEMAFEEPVVVLEPLVFAAKSLADDLAARLGRDGSTCTRLRVVAEAEHGERDERAWYRSSGLGAAEMVERVRWQLAGWIAGGEPASGVVLLRLVPEGIVAADGDQRRLWGGSSAADERAVRAVARLTSLVGDSAVLVPAWQGGRLPADRCGWVPAAPLDLLDAGAVRRRLGPLALEPPPGAGRGRRGAGDAAPPWPGSLPAPAPTVVLPEPEPAVLAGDDGRPVRVSGRGELSAEPVTLAVADRVPRLIEAWAGPWLLDERWWEIGGRRRVARLQVICDDGAAYLIGSESRRWWLLAAYR